MKGGKILITGGTGFLGVSLAQELLRRNPHERIVLSDIVVNERVKHLEGRVEFVPMDLTESGACSELLQDDIGTVYHFASLVSGGAEKNFEAGIRINVHSMMNLLEACRLKGHCPRFVFPSSIATFGGSEMPDIIDDYTHQHPQNSYGVAKVIGEQLLNDYSRKGFIDGRGVRLAAIIVRDEPNSAASGYASSIIREPVKGRDYVCPVPEETRIPILSIRGCMETLVYLGTLPQDSMGDYRSINSPSINPSALEIANTVKQAEAKSDRTFGKITFKPDPVITKLVESWPKIFLSKRAQELGINPDERIERTVEQYVNSVQAK